MKNIRSTLNPALGLAACVCALTFSGPAPAVEHSPHAALESRLATSPSAVSPLWRAVAASGEVTARTAEVLEVASVERGDQLPPRTLVTTGRRGRVTLTRSASLLIVDPESEIELPERSYGGMDTSVVQNSGSVLYEVDSRTNPHFEVVTPYLVAGVKGTAFLVTVNERYTAITVQRGVVEVVDTLSGSTLEVGAGESILREREQTEIEHFVSQSQLPKDVRREVRKMDRMERRDRRQRPVRADADERSIALELAAGAGDPDWTGASDKPYGGGAATKGGLVGVDDVAGFDDLLDDTRSVGTKGGAADSDADGGGAVDLPDLPDPAPDPQGVGPRGGGREKVIINRDD